MTMIAGQFNSLQLTMHQHRKRRSALSGRKLITANKNIAQSQPILSPLTFENYNDTLVEGHSFSSLEEKSFEDNTMNLTTQ